MGSYKDRRQAREWLSELEQLLGKAGTSGVSPDAKGDGVRRGRARGGATAVR